MNWREAPTGMIRHDELVNILSALSLTDCDKRTLAIVAEAVGVGDYYPPRRSAAVIEVIRPLLLEIGGQDD